MAQPQEVPLPILFLQMKYHIQTTLLCTGTKALNAYLSLNGKLQFPASPQNDSNKSIRSSYGKESFHHASGLHHSPCLFILMQYFHMFLYGIQCSLTRCEYVTHIYGGFICLCWSPFLVNLKNWKHMAWNFPLYIIANIKQDMYQNDHSALILITITTKTN